MTGFRLYPREMHYWSMQDYAAVLEVMDRLHPRTVLEFGPGSSTLALIEGGAEVIDACEDDPEWAAVYRARLESCYPAVKLHEYHWREKLAIPALDGKRYDLALVDGSAETGRRGAVIDYCLQRCAAVLVPTEEWRGNRARPELGLRRVCAEFALEYGRDIEIMETGPLSGAFALLT